MNKKQEKLCNQRKGLKLLLLVVILFLPGLGFISFEGRDTLHMGEATTIHALETRWQGEYTLHLPGTIRQININTADQDTLEALPGVGEKLAERIIAYREQNGPFLGTEEIVNVSGIGLKKLNQMKAYIVAE